MTTTKLSDYVVERIVAHTGVRHVFMLTGGMAMHLVESFGRHPEIAVIPTHHEQAAGIAANAYGRVRDLPGVALVTAGPGALNAVTPCGGAYMESTPMVFVSGQVSRANGRQGHPLRQRGIQEVEIVDVVQSITKYAVKIDDPSRVAWHLDRGLRLATSGRPGPVWFDIPVDVQGAMIDPASLERDNAAIGTASSGDQREALRRALSDLRVAARPLLVLGHGIRLAGAAKLAKELVERLGIPFQTTWNGMDLVGDDHPLYVGRANTFGARYANLVIQNADYVLAIGARFGIQHTGYDVEGFCRGAKLTAIDIDVAELQKPGLNVTEAIVMDAAEAIRELLSLAKNPGYSTTYASSWPEYCTSVKKRFPPVPTSVPADQPYVDPKYFIRVLSEKMPANAVFPFGSSGLGHTLTGGFFEVKSGQRVFTFKGLAAMGYGLPCAVGAAVAAPDRPVFTLVGEGGLQLNLQELQTVREQRLPIKVIVFNNGGYHSIRMTQKAFFAGHFVGSGPTSGVSFPRLEELASLYGLAYHRAAANLDLCDVVQRFVDEPGAAFLEVMLDPDQVVEPKVSSMKREDGTMVSRPIEDMAPLLDRDELTKLMFIPLREG